jgi:aspartyl-tRNA(Asn)/glutamyl-tRNA(Gln) amidotransferase subunit A
MEPLTDLTIARAAEAIRRREVAPLELTEAYLHRIERMNPAVNAYVLVTARRALDDARRATDEVVAGRYRGPLHGIPIGLKDLYDTAGIATAGGSKILAGRVPDEDSTAARKLREAGSVLLGKLNTHEFAWGATTNNPHTGATHNPWDLARVPGGSSGGSGAAIAAHMAAGTLGSDTGGSIRIPAAMCGCAGLKPTYGRVSKAGVLPMSFLYDHAGPITRTVEDAAILLEAIQGYDASDPNSARVAPVAYGPSLREGVEGTRLGVPREYFYAALDPEVREAVELALQALTGLGAEIVEVDLPLDRELMNLAFRVVIAEGQEYHREWIASRPGDYGADLQAVLSTPIESAGAVAASLAAGDHVRALFQEALEGVHALVTPTCPIPAPVIGQETVSLAGAEVPTTLALAGLTMPMNIARLPVLAIPCGFTASGLPISLSITGKAFDEATVLRIGHAYEQATDWHLRSPEEAGVAA